MTDNRTLALSLLEADSEQAVIELLNKAGFWDNPDAWRLCGDMDGNFSTIGNSRLAPKRRS